MGKIAISIAISFGIAISNAISFGIAISNAISLPLPFLFGVWVGFYRWLCQNDQRELLTSEKTCVKT